MKVDASIDMTRSTRIVELLGLPRTGKSTVALALHEYLKKSKGLNVQLVSDRASTCPVLDKTSPRFNQWTCVALIRSLIEAIDNGVDVLIADRGLCDALVWGKLFSEKSPESAQEYSDLKALVDIPLLQRHLLVGYAFFARPDTSLRRQSERSLIADPGRIVRKDVLCGYLRTLNDIRHDFPADLVEVDVEGQRIKEVISRVATDLISRLPSQPLS